MGHRGRLRQLLIAPLVVGVVSGCLPHLFDNPLDPLSPTYIGVISGDADADGVGQYADVDEITLVSPADGDTLSSLTPTLTVYQFDPSRVGRFWVEISVAAAPDFDGGRILSKDDYGTSECVVPGGLLISGPSYYWRAKAYDGTKWSDTWSGVRYFLVEAIGAFGHSPADGTVLTDTTPMLDWDDAEGATAYELQLGTDGTFAVQTTNQETLASEFSVVTALSNSTTYFWRVRTRGAGGVWGDWLGVWAFSIDLQPADHLTPPDGSLTSDTTPAFDWTTVPSAAAYQLQVGGLPDFSVPVVDTSDLVSSQYSVGIVLSDNSLYYWRVRWSNCDGVWSDWSASWSVRIDIAAPHLPAPPDRSRWADLTPWLSWTGEPSASDYRIQISTDTGFGTPDLDELVGGDPTYQVVTPLSDNSAHYWRVRARNEDGVWGDWSGTWRIDIGTVMRLGYEFGVIVKTDGTVWTFGYGGDGALGDGTTANRNTPAMVPSLGSIVSVSTSYGHVAALREDGTVWTWGRSDSGCLGDGTDTDRPTPVMVVGLTDIVAVSTGTFHNLALGRDETVWAWGSNGYGRLGDGTGQSQWVPVKVQGLGSVVALAPGGWHSVALLEDGSVWVWGYNGSCGVPGSEMATVFPPAQVAGLSGVVAIGAGFHNVALDADGAVWTWGRGDYGQLGDGTIGIRPQPPHVLDLPSITDVNQFGDLQVLAITSDSSVVSWGRNSYGMLGDGTTTDRTTPVAVDGLSGVVAVTSGRLTSGAVLANGTLWTWGNNNVGQLGHGTTGGYETRPVQVVWP